MFSAYINNLSCIHFLVNDKFCVQPLTPCPRCIHFWFKKAKKGKLDKGIKGFKLD